MPLVSVITPGRGRTDTFARCASSIDRQTYRNREHIVISDDCSEFFLTASEWQRDHLDGRVIMSSYNSSILEGYKPCRAANMRNLAVQESKGDFIAFLDDDNSWEPEHLSSLMQMFENNPRLEAAYSFRTLWNVDDTPYLKATHPWTDVEDREDRYRQLECMGIYSEGTNLVRDRLSGSSDGKGEVICTVDTSAWLVRRHIATAFPFPNSFSSDQQGRLISEDDAFGRELHHAGVVIATSGLFTLRYYLGGFSTTEGVRWTI